MKTMKSLIVGFALFVGMVGLSHASSAGGGWRPYTVYPASGQVISGNGFFNSMSISSGCAAGDWVAVFDTVAPQNTNYSALLSTAWAQITPAVLFATAPAVAGGYAVNNYWSAGQADDDYIEVTNGLFVFKSAASQGNCDVVTVYYRK